MPLRAHQPPGAARMLGDVSRRVAVLEREKNPVVSVPVAGGTFTDRTTGPGTLYGWWRMGDAINFAQTYTLGGYDIGDAYSARYFTNALLDSSGYTGGPRNLSYVEATTNTIRPVTQVANPSLGLYDDGAVQWPDSPNNPNGWFAATTTQLPKAQSHFGSGLLSLSVWHKTPSAPGGPIVARYGVDGSSVQVGWMLSAGMNGWSGFPADKAVLQFYDGTTLLMQGPSLAANTWYHIAVTWDSTTYRMYLNGLQVATSTHGGCSSGASENFAVMHAKIKQASVYFTYVGGGIADEVALYGVTLTAAQVQALASGIGYPVAARTVTAAYTPSSSDNYVFANGTFTVTLPTAVGVPGRQLTIKNIGAGTITVGRTGTETIDGTAANVTMATAKSARVFTSDGAGWQITSAYL